MRRSRSAPCEPSPLRLVPEPGSRFPSATAGFALRPCTGRTEGLAPSVRNPWTPRSLFRPLRRGRRCAAGGGGLDRLRKALRHRISRSRAPAGDPHLCRSYPPRLGCAGSSRVGRDRGAVRVHDHPRVVGTHRTVTRALCVPCHGKRHGLRDESGAVRYCCCVRRDRRDSRAVGRVRSFSREADLVRARSLPHHDREPLPARHLGER
jgi:hypothetical protein